jgi:hypothetical protein
VALCEVGTSSTEQENTISDNTIHLNFTTFYTTIYFDSVPAARVQRVGCRIGQRRKEKKLVVSRELQSAIIYKTETSERVTKSHVRRSFTVYCVNSGARLTVSTVAASLPSTSGVIVLSGAASRNCDSKSECRGTWLAAVTRALRGDRCCNR